MTPTPNPTPTPSPIVVTNTLDADVAKMAALGSTFAGCSSYATRTFTTKVNGKSTYKYVYGHMCTKNDLKLTLKFSTSQYKTLVQTTSLHAATMKNCVDISTTFK